MNELKFEVWYNNSKGTNKRKCATFAMRFEAEKYINIFHAADKEHFYIVDIKPLERIYIV